MISDNALSDITLSNYHKAKIIADKIDDEIINTLKLGKSFRVEAGAGSGKTYSLNKVVDWLQDNRWAEFKKRRQQIACITYTNAAVDVITSRLKTNSFIIPSTIHSFAWSAMKQFNSTLVRLVKELNLIPEDCEADDIKKVSYTLGRRYFEDRTLYLYHSDVIVLFVTMLENQKFRAILTQIYPIILIDEYQDSFASIMDKFIEHFISKEGGPQFGLFGDAWQTIYQINKACGLVVDEHLVEIKKESNFRSAPEIVDILNKLRPDLPQISAKDFHGEVIVITCNDYVGERRTDGHFRGDLPPDELEKRLNNVKSFIEGKMIKDETLKVLMITHKVLATQQGYPNLLELLGDTLKDKEDQFLVFFMNTVEPIYKALRTKNMSMLFEALGVRRFPIESKAQKKKWEDFYNKLTIARMLNAEKVLDTVISSNLVPIPPAIEAYYGSYKKGINQNYYNSTFKDFMKITYIEFINAMGFLQPDAVFSTEHGVKGEEYDNVIFVVGRGWNNYQFDIYMPMYEDAVPENKKASYERNRNLFYVCCSRPRRRLILFISVFVNDEFHDYLKTLFGEKNIIPYPQISM